MTDRKIDMAMDALKSRSNYFVYQANDLARAIGNLTGRQQKLLDFCFSFVEKEDKAGKVYQTNLADISKYFGLRKAGRTYTQLADSLRGLNLNTAVYLRTLHNDGSQGILMTSLFDFIEIVYIGHVNFRFSSRVAPLVFQLSQRFYSFRLSELSAGKGKYGLTLLRLCNANKLGKWRPKENPQALPKAVIKGSLEDWESWFLGSDNKGNVRHWPAGRFRQQVLEVAKKDLEKAYPSVLFDYDIIKNGRNVEGYVFYCTPIQTNVPM